MASSNIEKILKEHDGSMERSQLRVRLRGFKIGRINSKLDELAKEGKIKMSGDTVILIPTHPAKKILRRGNENEDGSVEPTGHEQVSIPYDKTLFRVEESKTLLEEITVDEGIADLLKAIWRHGIVTIGSCQGGDGEEAWIRFQWRKDVDRFNDLVGHLSRSSGERKWTFYEKSLQISFPPGHIAIMTEELNSRPISP